MLGVLAQLRVRDGPTANPGPLCAQDRLDLLRRTPCVLPTEAVEQRLVLGSDLSDLSLDGPPVARRIPRPEDTMTSPLPCTAAELAQARDELASVLDSPWLARDIGAHLTHRQAETIARWLRAVRGNHAAQAWLDGHALSDHAASTVYPPHAHR